MLNVEVMSLKQRDHIWMSLLWQTPDTLTNQDFLARKTKEHNGTSVFSISPDVGQSKALLMLA